jgi:putative transposase
MGHRKGVGREATRATQRRRLPALERSSLRKIIKTRGSFPNDDAALKLLYLAIRNARLRWRRGVAWTAAMGQFAIQFGARFPGSAN